MKKQVLGVKIDDVNIDQALRIVAGWLQNSEGKHYIVTPNPEIIMMSQTDLRLKDILNKSDLSVPDGVGLKLLTDIVCHTPGINLMESLIKMSSDYGFTTGFIGGKDEVAKKTAERLKKKYPNLKISFAESGGEVDKEGNSFQTHNTQYIISNTDILFVAFGPPKQEKWIDNNFKKIPVKVAMTVGGSFDYLSGLVPRAPSWVRGLGLEWLFRLIIQPWRIKRQFALIRYLFLLSSRTSSKGRSASG